MMQEDNKNLDLTKILKDCPIGWELYSSIYGNVTFRRIENNADCPIVFFFIDKNGLSRCQSVTKQGLYEPCYNGECTLFPSKTQRDWSKFSAPWYKKERFDTKTLKPFDRVLVRNSKTEKWRCEHFSYFNEGNECPYVTFISYKFCVPYNDDTKHLVGTTNDALEYYKYWKD